MRSICVALQTRNGRMSSQDVAAQIVDKCLEPDGVLRDERQVQHRRAAGRDRVFMRREDQFHHALQTATSPPTFT